MLPISAARHRQVHLNWQTAALSLAPFFFLLLPALSSLRLVLSLLSLLLVVRRQATIHIYIIYTYLRVVLPAVLAMPALPCFLFFSFFFFLSLSFSFVSFPFSSRCLLVSTRRHVLVPVHSLPCLSALLHSRISEQLNANRELCWRASKREMSGAQVTPSADGDGQSWPVAPLAHCFI